MRRARAKPILWAIGAMVSFGFVLIALAAGVVLWAERASLAGVNASLVAAAPWLLAWRLGLFALLLLYWRELTDKLCRLCGLGDETRVALYEWRWRAAAGLIFMDLVLVEDLIGHLLHFAA